MKKMLMAVLLASGINVFGAELPAVEGFMMLGQFETAREHLHSAMGRPETPVHDMHIYFCLATLNHIILKEKEGANVCMDLANAFDAQNPGLPLENRYLHFLARHAHTPNQATFNSQVVVLTQEKAQLSPHAKEKYSRKTKPFLKICVDKIEELDDAFVSFASCPDLCVTTARSFLETGQYGQAWDIFKERIKKAIEVAGESKREKITKFLQGYRSSLFQSSLTQVFDADDFKTAVVLCDMLMMRGERHSSVRLGGLIYYALNDIEKLKIWVSKIVHELSNPKEITLPAEIWLDQAFCVVTAHRLYEHLKIRNQKIANFYTNVMKNLDAEDAHIWENYYTEFMAKIDQIKQNQKLQAEKAQAELIAALSLSVSRESKPAGSGKVTKEKRVRASNTNLHSITR